VAFDNAGIAQPTTPAADVTEADCDRVISVNAVASTSPKKHEIPRSFSAERRPS
jgi:NAD(P)-dependent dehydrogenase (short-subunit alcohol dehydrogenase family)